jgi:hypothetical protein
MAEKEKKNTDPRMLERYELAALAAHLEKSSERRPYAAIAIRKFYTSCGVDPDDVIIANAINAGAIGPAVEQYSKKFEAALAETKISDYFNYANKRVKGMNPALQKLFKKYADLTLSEVIVKAKAREVDAGRVATAIDILKNHIFEGVLYPQIVAEATKKSLEAILAEE